MSGDTVQLDIVVVPDRVNMEKVAQEVDNVWYALVTVGMVRGALHRAEHTAAGMRLDALGLVALVLAVGGKEEHDSESYLGLRIS